ncbi:TlpA family protein disulfide reductase [Marinobacter sp.]|uniref:TlpA family protein disulfide reductase n=1 Tax=Marinobacter sp. TaxID=50741 RepID=UPI0034A5001E
MQYPATYRFRTLMMRMAAVLGMVMLAGCDKVAFEQAGGDPVEWDSLRGDWVLVNYWAEWCKPCLEEIPELNQLDDRDRITVLGVNFDGIQGQELIDLGDTMGIDFVMLTDDPGTEFGWKTPVALPATFVIDPDGELRETRFGPQTEEELRALMGG